MRLCVVALHIRFWEQKLNLHTMSWDNNWAMLIMITWLLFYGAEVPCCLSSKLWHINFHHFDLVWSLSLPHRLSSLIPPTCIVWVKKKKKSDYNSSVTLSNCSVIKGPIREYSINRMKLQIECLKIFSQPEQTSSNSIYWLGHLSDFLTGLTMRRVGISNVS